jgi:hypothetical protein
MDISVKRMRLVLFFLFIVVNTDVQADPITLESNPYAYSENYDKFPKLA